MNIAPSLSAEIPQDRTQSDARWLESKGASAAGIAAHYDVSNAFFALWLDPALVYTAALWEGEADTLAQAQGRKIDYYAQALSLAPGARVLDIGCGWGGAMERMCDIHGVSAAVGLTLSDAQASYIEARAHPRMSVHRQSWVHYQPSVPFDAVISIEAIEAFARQGLARAEKVRIYRGLFERAHAWLKPGGCFALQMIAYGSAGPANFDSFIANAIFPESDLPYLSEVIEAAEGLFETVSLRNDRSHYVRTLKCWLSNLKQKRAEARSLVGDAAVKRFEDYLRLSQHMFASGACDLHRVIFRRIARERAA